jgi:hypothetical protein
VEDPIRLRRDSRPSAVTQTANTQHVQDVRVCPPPYDGHIPEGLDLHPSPDEEFSVYKLNGSLERFYASVVVGFLRVMHEIERIRQWKDGGDRTLVALVVGHHRTDRISLLMSRSTHTPGGVISSSFPSSSSLAS